MGVYDPTVSPLLEERDGGEIVRAERVGYCPQPILYERLTCDEHFELFGRAHGMDDAAIERARETIYTDSASVPTPTLGSANSQAGRDRSSISLWR